jgi:two-component system NarL family response regulator
MLTSSDDESHLFEAVRAGAHGYLLKDVPPEEVAAGIRGLHHGHALVSPMMAAKLLTEFAHLSDHEELAAQAPGLEVPRLTRRELDILKLVARGRLNREIARELFISENTVRNHIRNILDKLQMHSRMEAAMYAVRQRLIDPD